MKWPVAAVFDVVATEYGWTDAQILDLTLGRLKVTLRVIADRKQEEQKTRLRLAENHARAIIGAMPGLAWSRKAGNSIRRVAESLNFLPGEKREKPLPTVEDVKGLFGKRG